MADNHKLRTPTTTSKAEVFDLPGTLRRLGGDTILLSDLVQLYNEDSPSLLERLHAGIEAQRSDEVRHAAHSLRGLAANFGALSLTQLLLRLEENAAAGRLDEAASLYDQVDENSARLQATLALHRR
jgi:two-component system, sensor histidine kinase and response regulator